MQNPEKSLRIYGVPFSVHTRKVILAARLKSIPYTLTPVVPVVPEQLPPGWRDISPTGLIPAIDDNGYIVADSTAIVLYLERKFPSPSLLPNDAQRYGTALFLDAWAGSELFRRVIHPLFHQQVVAPKIRKQLPDERSVHTASTIAAPEAFAYLERLAPERFFVGDALSIADLAIVSNLIMFHYLGYRIDTHRHPKLGAYFARHLSSEVLVPVLEAEREAVETLGLDRKFLA